MLDPDRVIEPRPVWLVWRDHTMEDGLSERPENPRPIILAGWTNLIEETEDAYIVCQFVGRDEFCVFYRIAICKSDVVSITILDDERTVPARDTDSEYDVYGDGDSPIVPVVVNERTAARLRPHGGARPDARGRGSGDSPSDGSAGQGPGVGLAGADTGAEASIAEVSDSIRGAPTAACSGDLDCLHLAEEADCALEDDGE